MIVNYPTNADFSNFALAQDNWDHESLREGQHLAILNKSQSLSAEEMVPGHFEERATTVTEFEANVFCSVWEGRVEIQFLVAEELDRVLRVEEGMELLLVADDNTLLLEQVVIAGQPTWTVLEREPGIAIMGSQGWVELEETEWAIQ